MIRLGIYNSTAFRTRDIAVEPWSANRDGRRVAPCTLGDYYGPFCGWCLERLPQEKRNHNLEWDDHHPIQRRLRDNTAFPEFSFAEAWTYPACTKCHPLVDGRAAGLTARLLSALQPGCSPLAKQLAIKVYDPGLYAIVAPLKLRLALESLREGFVADYQEHLAYALPAIAGTHNPAKLAAFMPRRDTREESPRLEINAIGVAYACYGRYEAARQLEKATLIASRRKALTDEGIKSLFHRRAYVVSRDRKQIRLAHEIVQTPYHASTHHTILAVHETGECNEAAARVQWGLAIEQGTKTSALYQALHWFADAVSDWDKPNSDKPVYMHLVMAQYVYALGYLGHNGIVAAQEAHPFANRTPLDYLLDVRWSHLSSSMLDGWRREALMFEGRPNPLRDRMHALLYDFET